MTTAGHSGPVNGETAETARCALDSVTRSRIIGWVDISAKPTSIIVTVDGMIAARIQASGRTPIDVRLEPPMPPAPHTVAVVRESDGLPLLAHPVELPGLRGHIDEANRERLRGWAQDTGQPDQAVCLSIAVDGEVVGRVVANAYRDDLERHAIGNGRHAFEHVFQPPLSRLRHVIALSREADGAALAQSPVALPTPDRFDASLRESIADALDTALTDEDLRERLDFLAEQMQRLLQRRSDRATTRTRRLAERQFRTRWSGPVEADMPALKPRALVIDATLPDMTRDAGSAAVVSHALSLQRLGYDVVLAAADMSAKGAEVLERLGIACCHAPWFGSIEEVLRAQSHCFDVVYLHRVAVALPYLALVRRHLPKARVLYSVADLHHLRLARQSVIEARPEIANLSRLIRKQELLAASAADAVITHSAAEADLLRGTVPGIRVHVIPWDIAARPGLVPFARRSGFAFVGHYGHMPNVDAALWLVNDVMPVLRSLDPGIVCHLVGTAMPELLEMPRLGVNALGKVDDLAALFGGVRLTVAPLQYGAGIKGKVLDSLAAGVPCVCTGVAMEGLALGPALRSLVANDPAGFAASIHRLHSDPKLHAACREEGLSYVATELASHRIDALMQAAIRPD